MPSAVLIRGILDCSLCHRQAIMSVDDLPLVMACQVAESAVQYIYNENC